MGRPPELFPYAFPKPGNDKSPTSLWGKWGLFFAGDSLYDGGRRLSRLMSIGIIENPEVGTSEIRKQKSTE